MMFEYKRLIKHDNLLNIMRMSYCCRHINMIIISLQHEKITHDFWQHYADQFLEFKISIANKKKFYLAKTLQDKYINLQQKIALQSLSKAANNWNKICTNL